MTTWISGILSTAWQGVQSGYQKLDIDPSVKSAAASLAFSLLYPSIYSSLPIAGSMLLVAKVGIHTIDSLSYFFDSKVSRTKIAASSIQAMAALIGAIDPMGILPGGIGTRLFASGVSFASMGIDGVRLLQNGTQIIRKAAEEPLQIRTLQKVTAGICLVGLGTIGIASCCVNIANLAKGLLAYASLNPEQQYFVRKFRSIQTLPLKKECRAVVIDGHSSEWGGVPGDDASIPSCEALYRTCDVRAYRIDPRSPTPVCDVLSKASRDLGGPIDIVSQQGHGDEYMMKLGKLSFFYGDSRETSCMRPHLAPKAQIVLHGCHSAGRIMNPLAKRVASVLPGVEVVGFKSLSHPFYQSAYVEAKKLVIREYTILPPSWTNPETYCFPSDALD